MIKVWKIEMVMASGDTKSFGFRLNKGVSWARMKNVFSIRKRMGFEDYGQTQDKTIIVKAMRSRYKNIKWSDFYKDWWTA